MSRADNVWDNAAMKSFFSSLKTERTDRKVYRTTEEAKADVFDYIERFDNAKRRHSTIGSMSPMESSRPVKASNAAALPEDRMTDAKSVNISAVCMLKPRYFKDARGYFVETYNKRSAQQSGIKAEFVQDNEALSLKRGTVRGLHFQVPPKAQAKLVRVLRGIIYDVAVDLRLGSPTYGEWAATTLAAQSGEQVFIPHGFAHGYCTLEDETEVAYKVDEYYAPECELGIVWNDSTLAIPWPVSSADVVLADKDRRLPGFDDFVSPFRYDGE
jgi:dTDP-4-dehydrorhamnose 3,5-epimerase